MENIGMYNWPFSGKNTHLKGISNAEKVFYQANFKVLYLDNQTSFLGNFFQCTLFY